MNISEFIETAKTLNVLGIKITKDNETAAEWYSEAECRRNIYSATKSFTSCAMGFAVQEGLISLDEKLTDAFAEDLPDSIDENLKAATVRDLLTMCLGQEHGNLMGAQRPLYKEDDWVKMSLAIPFKYKPGTHFVYNNVGPYLAGILVQRRAGCDLVSYLTPRLFPISELNVRYGKLTLLETALVRAVYSSPFPNFTASGYFILTKANGTENRFYPRNG